VRASDQLESKAATPAGLDADTMPPFMTGKASQDMFVDSFSEQMAGQKNTSRIMTAIREGRVSFVLPTDYSPDSSFR